MRLLQSVISKEIYLFQKKRLRFEAKKPYEIGGNQKRSALSKKEQPNTLEKYRENLN